MHSRALRIAGILGLLAVVLMALLLVNRAPETLKTVSTTKLFSSEKYGISFSYPDTYVLSEVDAPGSALRTRRTITLIHEEDLPTPEAGEGPPAITIDLYQNNQDRQTTEGWIKGSSDSNYKLGDGTLASTTVSGLAALSYRWSGLYEGTTVAVARPDWIYAFTATYFEMGSQINQDFAALLKSVKITYR